jgi:ATP-dependent Lon protease
MLLHDRKRRAMLHPEDADARYELGEALFTQKQYDAAVKQLEKALSLRPDHDNARRLLARAYIAEDRMTLAERTLEEGVRRRPDDAGMRDELAEVLVTAGRIDDAIVQLEEGLRADPDNLTRLLRTADLALRRSLLERARGHVERARRIAPEDPRLAERLQEIALGLGDAGPAPTSPLDRGQEFLLGRARAAFAAPPLREATEKGALREALERLGQLDLKGAKRALVTAPAEEQTSAVFALCRAEITLLSGDREKAEGAFRRCVEKEPLLALGWSRLGELLRARSQFDEAARVYEELCRLSPEDADAAEGHGDALFWSGHPKEAIERYRRALSLRPDALLAAKLSALTASARRAEEEERPVGRLGALGWNATGGVVSALEAVAVPGKGELFFTGNIGKASQDAARVAHSCLKARADALGIEDEVKRLDLHFHFIDTELQKDGPSAGLALALAGISAYTRRPLRPRLAATGEISLLGAVRAVGGLHEKISAAYLGGIETVIVPRRNLFEVKGLSKEVVSRVSLIYVDSLVEALEHALLARPPR